MSEISTSDEKSGPKPELPTKVIERIKNLSSLEDFKALVYQFIDAKVTGATVDPIQYETALELLANRANELKNTTSISNKSEFNVLSILLSMYASGGRPPGEFFTDTDIPDANTPLNQDQAWKTYIKDVLEKVSKLIPIDTSNDEAPINLPIAASELAAVVEPPPVEQVALPVSTTSVDAEPSDRLLSTSEHRPTQTENQQPTIEEVWEWVKSLENFAINRSDAQKIEAQTFSVAQGADQDYISLYQKFAKFERDPAPVGKENDKDLIIMYVRFFNLFFDLFESNGGVKHRMLQDKITDQQVQYGPLFGSIKKFRGIISKQLPELSIPEVDKKTGLSTGRIIQYVDKEQGELKSGERQKIELIDIVRQAAIHHIRAYETVYPLGDLGAMYDELEKRVFNGFSYDSQDLNGKPVKIIERGLLATHFPNLPPQLQRTIFQLIKLDLQDLAFLPKRAQGSSLSFGSSLQGGSLEINGQRISSYTDLLSHAVAAGYEINNKPESSQPFVDCILLYKEGAVKSIRDNDGNVTEKAPLASKNAPNAVEKFYADTLEFYKTEFSEAQLEEMFGQLDVDTSTYEFPPLSVAIEKGYVVQPGEWYVAAGGWLYMREHIMEPLKHLSENDLRNKASDWFSNGIGKYKVIRNGVNQRIIQIYSRVYLARLFNALEEASAGRLDKRAENAVLELVPRLWNATTVSSISTEISVENLKLDLIFELFEPISYERSGMTEEEKNNSSFRHKAIKVLQSTNVHERDLFFGQFKVSKRLLQHLRLFNTVQYNHFTWKHTHPRATFWERRIQNLRYAVELLGLRETDAPVPPRLIVEARKEKP